MQVTLTGVFEQQDDTSWIAWVEELPGANTQGESLEEAKENLQDAIAMVLEGHREEAERELQGRRSPGQIVREPVCFA